MTRGNPVLVTQGLCGTSQGPTRTRREAAPAPFLGCHLLCFLKSVSPVFSQRATRRKSARFRAGSCCLAAQSLSRSLQAGIRFFRHPLPAVASVGLTAHFPRGTTSGLPCSVQLPEWGRFSLFAGSAAVHDRRHLSSYTRYLPFGSSQQHLGLVLCYDVYQEFTCVNPATQP